ncbi:MAG: hypothetical protein IKC92_01955, partial [Tidjanibacter sp.]|nr:hypothetical protein [Tidjanibacter sp.]
LRCPKNRSILGVCEDFEGERNAAIKPGAETACRLCRGGAVKSPRSGISVEITLLGSFTTKQESCGSRKPRD